MRLLDERGGQKKREREMGPVMIEEEWGPGNVSTRDNRSDICRCRFTGVEGDPIVVKARVGDETYVATGNEASTYTLTETAHES